MSSKDIFSKNNKRASIDGVSSRPSVSFGDVGKGATRRPSGNNLLGGKKGPNALSDFKRKDGFHPAKQQQVRRQPGASSVAEISKPKKIPKEIKRKKILGFIPGKKQTGNLSKKPLTRKQKIIRGSAASFAVLILVGGIFGYSYLKNLLPGGGGAAALLKNVEPSKLKGEGDGRVNILLLGRGGEGHEGADLTDTIILASIDPLANEASLVSVPRDLYVSVNDVGAMKVNSVFFSGKESYYYQQNLNGSEIKEQDAEKEGFKLLENTLSDVLGVPIHYRVIVDFKGFEKAVDNVGGVTIDAPDSVVETMWLNGQNYELNVQPGVQTMDGFEALAYARSRYTSPRGDFDRSERQRIMISALKDKIISQETFSNPQKIAGLLSTFGNHVHTNFSIQDMQRLHEISQKITPDKIYSIGMVDPPNVLLETANIDGLSVVVPVAGVGEYKDIQFFIRNELKDSYLKDENAKIIVLNGTLVNGLATQKGEELKSFGYTVSRVGNAPTKNYNSTTIVDLRNGENKYTQNYLEKRFGATAVNSLPDNTIDPGQADFVIILGADQAN